MEKINVELSFQEVCDVAIALKRVYNDEEHFIQTFEFNDALKNCVLSARKQSNRFDDLHTKFLDYLHGGAK